MGGSDLNQSAPKRADDGLSGLFSTHGAFWAMGNHERALERNTEFSSRAPRMTQRFSHDHARGFRNQTKKAAGWGRPWTYPQGDPGLPLRSSLVGK